MWGRSICGVCGDGVGGWGGKGMCRVCGDGVGGYMWEGRGLCGVWGVWLWGNVCVFVGGGI